MADIRRDVHNNPHDSRVFWDLKSQDSTSSDDENSQHGCTRKANIRRQKSMSTLDDTLTMKLLLEREREHRRLQRMLRVASDTVQSELLRASEAESRLVASAQRIHSLQSERQAALHELAVVKTELALYKQSHETARNELLRAQAVVNEAEENRREAQEDAEMCRSRMRRMREDALMREARDAGWRQGLLEGIERGREEGYHEGLRTGYDEGQDDARQRIEQAVNEVQDVPAAEEFMLPPTEDSYLPPPDPSRMREPMEPPPQATRPPTTPPTSPPVPIPFRSRSSSYPQPDPPVARPPSLPRSSSYPRPPTSQSNHRPRPRHRSSMDSQTSSNLSSYDLVSHPSQPNLRRSNTVLSVIPEVSTPGSTYHTSPSQQLQPTPLYVTNPSPAHTSPTPLVPTPQAPIVVASAYTVVNHLEKYARGMGSSKDLAYRRPRSDSSGSGSSSSGEPAVQVSPPTVPNSPSSAEVGIFIQPPSRPQSHTSGSPRTISSATRGSLLTPDSANRPMPPPRPASPSQPRMPPPQPMYMPSPTATPGNNAGGPVGPTPIFAVVDQLPPGFVPMGPPIAATGR